MRVIGGEPQLRNREIAQIVGINEKGHASTVFARLARFGLTENLLLDPLPFEPNAWRLTAAGAELLAAVGEDTRPAVNGSSHAAGGRGR